MDSLIYYKLEIIYAMIYNEVTINPNEKIKKNQMRL